MNPGLLVLLIVGGYFLLKGDKKRDYLKTVAQDELLWQRAVKLASDQEISDMYTFHTEYFLKNMQLPDGDLKNRIMAISAKYNIYT